MSSIVSKRKRKESKLTYKQLYEIELHNRKMYEEQYKKICQENIEIQKGSELPKLRLQIRQLSSDLDDQIRFNEFETLAKNVLLYRQKEIKRWLEENDDDSMYEMSSYLHDVLNGDLDEQLKEKWEEKEDGE